MIMRDVAKHPSFFFAIVVKNAPKLLLMYLRKAWKAIFSFGALCFCRPSSTLGIG